MINPINNSSITDYNNIKGKADEAKQGAFEGELEKALAEKDEKKLRKACNDLESVFVNMMFKQMRSTIQKTNLMGDDMGTDMYEDMLFEKYAEEIGKGKGIGLGDVLYKQLAKTMKNESEEGNVK